MSISRNAIRAAAVASLAGFVLAACRDTSADAATAPQLRNDIASSRASLGADVEQQIAALRRLTAPLNDTSRADAAGWSAQITPCMENPPLGAMGFHYGNPAYIDGMARALEPELLMYEPAPNGGTRLVGVEYIVPLSAWKGTSPPELYGQQFKVNEAFGVWALATLVHQKIDLKNAGSSCFLISVEPDRSKYRFGFHRPISAAHA